MSEEKTYTKQGIVKLRKYDEKWDKYSFKLDDNNWYSQFANRFEEETLDVIKSLVEGDTVLFKWQPSGKYRNFIDVEKIILRESPPDDGPPSHTSRSYDGDLGMYLCNAANVAGGIYQKLIEKAEDAEEVTEGIFESLYDMVMMCHNKHRKEQ